MTDVLHSDELFMPGDNGPYWVTAEDRSPEDAVAFVAKFVGPFDQSITCERVTGRFEEIPVEGPFFHKDPDGDVEMWEIDAS